MFSVRYQVPHSTDYSLSSSSFVFDKISIHEDEYEDEDEKQKGQNSSGHFIEV
jgi:hypothetical protein